MSAPSGCRAALAAPWVTVDEQQVRCWAGCPSRLGEGGVTGHRGLTQQMSPSFTPQEPLCQTLVRAWGVEPGRRGSRLRVCAKGTSTGCCRSYSPLTGSLSPCPSPAPSVRGGTGKEEGRHWVSGGLGCVLGCSLLLLSPGEPGMSSQDAGVLSRRAASVTGINNQCCTISIFAVFENYLIYRLLDFSTCERCEIVAHYSNLPSLMTSDLEHKNIHFW